MTSQRCHLAWALSAKNHKHTTLPTQKGICRRDRKTLIKLHHFLSVVGSHKWFHCHFLSAMQCKRRFQIYILLLLQERMFKRNLTIVLGCKIKGLRSPNFKTTFEQEKEPDEGNTTVTIEGWHILHQLAYLWLVKLLVWFK